MFSFITVLGKQRHKVLLISQLSHCRGRLLLLLSLLHWVSVCGFVLAQSVLH